MPGTFSKVLRIYSINKKLWNNAVGVSLPNHLSEKQLPTNWRTKYICWYCLLKERAPLCLFIAANIRWCEIYNSDVKYLSRYTLTKLKSAYSQFGEFFIKIRKQKIFGYHFLLFLFMVLFKNFITISTYKTVVKYHHINNKG